MTVYRKRVIRFSFVAWLGCWLYIPFVLLYAKEMPATINTIWLILLIISSWVFFLLAAKAKGYSYIIGIGLMMLNIIGAAILAFLPDKSTSSLSEGTAASKTKGATRKFLTAYIWIWMFFWFYAINAETVPPDSLPILLSVVVGFIAAAVVWIVPWPLVIWGDPLPPMREGYRRMCLLVLAVGSLTWWAFITIASNWFATIESTGVFAFFAGPVGLFIAITILTRAISWVRAGFLDDGKKVEITKHS